jgi:hypothetical protein
VAGVHLKDSLNFDYLDSQVPVAHACHTRWPHAGLSRAGLAHADRTLMIGPQAGMVISALSKVNRERPENPVAALGAYLTSS